MLGDYELQTRVCMYMSMYVRMYVLTSKQAYTCRYSCVHEHA